MNLSEKIQVASNIFGRITDPELEESPEEKIIAVDGIGQHFVLLGAKREDLKSHQRVSFFGVKRVAGVNVVEEIKP